MKTSFVIRGIILAAFFSLSNQTCKVQIESVDCTHIDTANLSYTCRSELHERKCLCYFENPLLSAIGWQKMCKAKNELKLEKKKIRKRQIQVMSHCVAIQPPRPGKVYCSVTPREITCRGRCNNGYKFLDMSEEATYHCYYSEGIWRPNSYFPECKPECIPPCKNRGTCVAPNVCACPNNYTGDRCQYSMRLCAIMKNYLASSWHCTHSRIETSCDISCNAPGTRAAEIDVQRHVCSNNGVWFPPLPPCVQGSNLCFHPGDIEFGTSLPDVTEFKKGSSITYTCSEGYEILGSAEIICHDNGKWKPEKPKCAPIPKKIILDQCSKPNAPKDSVVTVIYPGPGPLRTHFSYNLLYLTSISNSTEDQDISDTDGIFPVGTRVQYKCKSRYYKLYGSEYQTCQSSHTWSGYQPACVPECGKSDSPKTPFVVNGDSTHIGQWPWMVGIGLKTSKGMTLICGGVLISEFWVLTAAHCVAKSLSNVPIDVKNLVIFCGKYYRKFDLDDEYVQRKQVKQIIIHDEYDFTHYDGDIALLRMEEPVELTTRVQPICLPTEFTTRENIRDGKKGMVIGWGLTENGTYSDILRETILPVVSHDKCEEAYREGLRRVTITVNMFCAGHETGVFDTCSGDSGGPFMFSVGPPSDNRWYLEGLVSWGSNTGCAKAKRYSGFTKVAAFISWINMFI